MGRSRTGGNQPARCRSQTSGTTSSNLVLNHRGFSSVDIRGVIPLTSSTRLSVGTCKCPSPSLRVGMLFSRWVALALGLRSPRPPIGVEGWSSWLHARISCRNRPRVLVWIPSRRAELCNWVCSSGIHICTEKPTYKVTTFSQLVVRPAPMSDYDESSLFWISWFVANIRRPTWLWLPRGSSVRSCPCIWHSRGPVHRCELIRLCLWVHRVDHFCVGINRNFIFFGSLSRCEFGSVGRPFYAIYGDFERNLFAHYFLLVLWENRVFIEDYITTSDQISDSLGPIFCNRQICTSLHGVKAWFFSPVGWTRRPHIQICEVCCCPRDRNVILSN